MSRIWIITHNAPPPEQDVRVRNKAMAKYLTRMGHDVTIFGVSTIHNTNINLITGNELFIERVYGGLKYVHVKAPSYTGNGLARIINLVVYPFNLWRATRKFQKPDVIINDLEVYAFNFPFMIATRYKCPIISEIRDLTPESLVAYGYLKKNSIIAKILYKVEKNIYVKSDHIIFTMEGGYEYLRERGLDKIIPREKISFINNGVDLEVFYENREKYCFEDKDLEDKDVKNIVYTGSIRRVNNLGLLLDVAKLLQEKEDRVRLLIWGSGNEIEKLKKRLVDENIHNVIFKGRVEKQYVPSIVSRAYLNIAHNSPSEILRFGISFNKVFDYMAAGKPIICDFPCPFNPVVDFDAGVGIENPSAENIAAIIEQFVMLSDFEYQRFCQNALDAAKQYDYKELTKRMSVTINRLLQKKNNIID